jgi:hypothetical protein
MSGGILPRTIKEGVQVLVRIWIISNRKLSGGFYDEFPAIENAA